MKKNSVFLVLKTLIGIFIAMIVPLGFVFSTVLPGMITANFDLTVDPSYSGGRAIVQVYDDFNDDNGAGSLTYPLHERFAAEGTMDLVRYSVYRPQTLAPWSDEGSYWQLGLTFREVDEEAPFSQQIISIYIDLAPGGSTETPNPRAQMVRFSPAHAWDLEITIVPDREAARITSFDNSFETEGTVYRIPEDNSIFVRLPLEGMITNVLDGRETAHYLMVGGYDSLGESGWMSVRQRSGMETIGGAQSRLTPKIVDYLAPEGMDQQEMLAGYDSRNYTYAQLEPVIIRENTPTPVALARISPAYQLRETSSRASTGESGQHPRVQKHW
ncbi:MAG: glucodextranase DOMON-like domain-containing protein [Spirochaetia bacterium]